MDHYGKSSERLTLIEMERQLLQDKNGHYRKEVLQQLEQYQQWVKTKIATGLSPSEFAVYEKLKKALDSAQEIIINFK
jgi:DNA-binding protein H-NS